MHEHDLSLVAFCDHYLSQRNTTAKNASNMRRYSRSLTEFAGGTLAIDQVEAEAANRWLSHLLATGTSAHTAHSYRAGIVSLLNAAADQGLITAVPRIRRVKRPSLLVEAYTRGEIRDLVQTAANLAWTLPVGVPGAAYWQAMIRVAWDTGLRRGDLWQLDRTHIHPDGRFRIVQSKTKVLHVGKISQEGLDLLRQLRSLHPLAWPHADDVFCRQFAKLREAAGIMRGSFKWVRRAAGSYAEARQPGDGHRILGQTSDRCFKANYEDKSITSPDCIGPIEL
jgi:integrase